MCGVEIYEQCNHNHVEGETVGENKINTFIEYLFTGIWHDLITGMIEFCTLTAAVANAECIFGREGVHV